MRRGKGRWRGRIERRAETKTRPKHSPDFKVTWECKNKEGRSSGLGGRGKPDRIPTKTFIRLKNCMGWIIIKNSFPRMKYPAWLTCHVSVPSSGLKHLTGYPKIHRISARNPPDLRISGFRGILRFHKNI